MQRRKSSPDTTGFGQALADLDSVPASKTHPYFGSIVASATGELWVSDPVIDPALPLRWTVVSQSGAEVANVTLPPYFTPSRITSDKILGIVRDPADQKIAVLALTKK
jgi:hypothetical protein